MSLKSAPDRSYDVPPADERKGKTKAESDRHLGNPVITHRSTLTRHPAGTRAAPRQKNVAGMNYWRRPAATPTCERRVTQSSPCAGADRPAMRARKSRTHQRPSLSHGGALRATLYIGALYIGALLRLNSHRRGGRQRVCRHYADTRLPAEFLILW